MDLLKELEVINEMQYDKVRRIVKFDSFEDFAKNMEVGYDFFDGYYAAAKIISKDEYAVLISSKGPTGEDVTYNIGISPEHGAEIATFFVGPEHSCYAQLLASGMEPHEEAGDVDGELDFDQTSDEPEVDIDMDLSVDDEEDTDLDVDLGDEAPVEELEEDDEFEDYEDEDFLDLDAEVGMEEDY